MTLFDRFILTLYSLTLTIVSIGAIAVFLRWIPFQLVLLYLEDIYASVQPQWVYLAVAGIFFLISLKFLFQGFRFRKGAYSSHPVITQRTEIGHVSISLATIESISLKATRRVRGTRDVKSIVHTDETGTSLTLKVTVDGETPIPTIVEEIQTAVKNQVEQIVGIEVRTVDVKVTEVAQVSTSPRLNRVE